MPSCDWSSDVCSDRKSTRLNSSHTIISYAVFCLKNKKPWGGAFHRLNAFAALRPRGTVAARVWHGAQGRGGCVWAEGMGLGTGGVFFFLMIGGPPGSAPFPSRAFSE